MSKFFTVSWLELQSALVSGFIMALIVVIANVISVGDVFSIDVKTLTNAGVIAFLTSFVSYLKSLLTTESGSFLGMVKVK